MLKKISTIPFKGTPEQAEKLQAVIAECKGDKSLLMHVMQEAQEIYGYLPYEVQIMIAEGMDVPLEKVYGVSTFYAQFSLSPKGENNVSENQRSARHRPRRMHRGRQFLAGSLPLYRRVRVGARAHRQRRSVR